MGTVKTEDLKGAAVEMMEDEVTVVLSLTGRDADAADRLFEHLAGEIRRGRISMLRSEEPRS